MCSIFLNVFLTLLDLTSSHIEVWLPREETQSFERKFAKQISNDHTWILVGNPPPYDVAGGRGGANEAGDHGAGQPLMEENNNEENEGNNNGDINGNSDMVDHNEVRRRQMEGDRGR